MHRRKKNPSSFCSQCDKDGWWLHKELACSKKKKPKKPWNIASGYGVVTNVKIFERFISILKFAYQCIKS